MTVGQQLSWCLTARPEVSSSTLPSKSRSRTGCEVLLLDLTAVVSVFHLQQLFSSCSQPADASGGKKPPLYHTSLLWIFMAAILELISVSFLRFLESEMLCVPVIRMPLIARSIFPTLFIHYSIWWMWDVLWIHGRRSGGKLICF